MSNQSLHPDLYLVTQAIRDAERIVDECVRQLPSGGSISEILERTNGGDYMSHRFAVALARKILQKGALCDA